MDSRMADWKDRYTKWVEKSQDDWRAGRKKQVLQNYPFMVFEDTPWTPFSGKASDHTFALITSGGLYLQGKQDPFETESIHGDLSFREIPKGVKQNEIGIAHPFYDHCFVEKDIIHLIFGFVSCFVLGISYLSCCSSRSRDIVLLKHVIVGTRH
ncbi:MAG: hypothetical protein DRG87_11950 [Deltaproteobacteria bacterium]|nr:MAG: hypothetical protein DRG87_11950 [Deltaproteobacteria bacterium]